MSVLERSLCNCTPLWQRGQSCGDWGFQRRGVLCCHVTQQLFDQPLERTVLQKQKQEQQQEVEEQRNVKYQHVGLGYR